MTLAASTVAPSSQDDASRQRVEGGATVLAASVRHIS